MSMTLPFDVQVKAAGLPEPEPEYRFCSTRKWRFDWAFVGEKIAVEQEGGVWKKGGSRHNRASGFVKDCEKYNEAACLGWRVLRFPTEQIADGTALRMIQRILNQGD